MELLRLTLTDYVILLDEGSGAKSTPYEKAVTEIIEGQRSKIYYFEIADAPLIWGGYLIATTSFIPTFAYMAALLIFLIAGMMIKATMHVLEVVTQFDPKTHPEKFKPWTMLGVLLGLVAAFTKIMAQLVA